MSTVMKKNTGSMGSPPAKQLGDEKQLWHDRWTAAIVVAVILALMALVIWLASMGGGVEYDGIEYWQMMP